MATVEGQSADVVPEFGCFSCRSIFFCRRCQVIIFLPLFADFLGFGDRYRVETVCRSLGENRPTCG